MGSAGSKITTTQFFLYGKKHFTLTGWTKAQAHYTPRFLEDFDLKGRVAMVTGANSGIGKEVAQYWASRGGRVYMVCRSRERAEVARREIEDVTEGRGEVRVLLGDVSLRSDVHRIVEELESSGESKLDALVCNAGALLDKRQLTAEGLETTFACHLLNGAYVLSQRCLPLLHKAAEPRVILVSSGGMYNTKVPSWNALSSQGPAAEKKYDGTMAYAYAKRGQVLLAEKWATAHGNVQFVSCHPGWVDTPGVDAAFGSKKKWLKPMRTPWQGAEGIAWLSIAPAADITPGAFYLDRQPQPKHIAGYFMSEGSYTKNTPEEVAEMMQKLEEWATRPADVAQPLPPEPQQSNM